jgi:hypothetical protein
MMRADVDVAVKMEELRRVLWRLLGYRGGRRAPRRATRAGRSRRRA